MCPGRARCVAAAVGIVFGADTARSRTLLGDPSSVAAVVRPGHGCDARLASRRCERETETRNQVGYDNAECQGEGRGTMFAFFGQADDFVPERGNSCTRRRIHYRVLHGAVQFSSIVGSAAARSGGSHSSSCNVGPGMLRIARTHGPRLRRRSSRRASSLSRPSACTGCGPDGDRSNERSPRCLESRRSSRV